MANYKINRNKPELTEEQISRHKNFGKLVSEHQKVLNYKDATRPLYKNPKFFGLITLLGIVMLLVLLPENKEKKEPAQKVIDSNVQEKKLNQKVTDTTSSSATVIDANEEKTTSQNQLEKEVAFTLPEIPFKSFNINGANGGVIYSGNARILIPPLAFKDKTGNVLTKNISIRYREFKDPVDIFLSGIPMHYDSSSNERQLVSAGMFEIKGFSGKEEVKIAIPLTVEYAGFDHNGYNLYYLSETVNEWQYKGKDKQAIRFMVQSNDQDFPELAPLKNVIWELSVNEKQKNPEQFKHIFSKEWNQFFVGEKELQSRKISVKHLASEPKFYAVPVALNGNDKISNELIDSRLEEYYQLLKKKDQELKKIEEARKKRVEWESSAEGKAYLNWLKSPEGQKQNLSSRIISEFSIDKFGIWNCDQPQNLPKGAEVKPAFVDQNGQKLVLEKTCLVDYSRNAIFFYYANTAIRFNPKVSNTLWAALPGGKIALFSPEKFKSVPASGSYTFRMEVVDINGKSTEEVRKILNLKNHSIQKTAEREKNPVATYERMIKMVKLKREEDFYRKGKGSIGEDFNLVLPPDTDNIWMGPVTKDADYPEGIQNYIKNNLNLSTKVKGRIIVTLTILATGKVENVVLYKDETNCQTCVEEVIKVISNMPDWNPAESNGKPVTRRLNLPILF